MGCFPANPPPPPPPLQTSSPPPPPPSTANFISSPPPPPASLSCIGWIIGCFPAGVVHLEALELLSRECETKVRLLLCMNNYHND